MCRTGCLLLCLRPTRGRYSGRFAPSLTASQLLRNRRQRAVARLVERSVS